MRRAFPIGVLFGLIVVLALAALARVATAHLMSQARKSVPFTLTQRIEARASRLWLRWSSIATPLVLVGGVAAAALGSRILSRRHNRAAQEDELVAGASQNAGAPVHLASAYQWMIFWLFVSLVWPFVLRALPEAPGSSSQILLTAYWYVLFATICALPFYGYCVARLLGTQMPSLWGLLLLLPLANVATVVVLSMRLRKAWAAQGIAWGLFGPRRRAGGP